MKKCLFVLLLFCYATLQSQPAITDAKRDYTWVFGRRNNDNPGSQYSGGSLVKFADGQHIVSAFDFSITLDATNASISDTAGNLLFYCNGRFINDRFHHLMIVGTGLCSDQYCDDGYFLPQGVIILPYPEHPQQYLILHSNFYQSQLVVNRLKVTTVDMNLQNGLGQVIQKNVPLLETELDYGKLVATRHANGRDWWVLVPKRNVDTYYRILVDPAGAKVVGEQSVGVIVPTELGQCCFSPDGSHYVHMSFRGGETAEDTLALYDFDRCSGLLSNPRLVTRLDSSISGGVAFSPNSRFLYWVTSLYTYQYDVQDSNGLATSESLVGVLDTIEWPIIGTYFLAQPGPDGRIYITTANSKKYLHVINYPDEKGPACDFCNRCLTLPKNNHFSIPNFPNFRLGPVDGSVCDSLGINVGVVNDELEMRKEEYTVWPNPFNETLHIKGLGTRAGMLRLYDQFGRVALEARVFPVNDRVETGHLPIGFYFWEFRVSGVAEPVTGKCVKILGRN